jgi:putative transposase
VYDWLEWLMRRMAFKTTHYLAFMLVRICSKREVVPSAGVVDSQSVKVPAAAAQGYDVARKSTGVSVTS